MKAYKTLVKAALADGHLISVFDGEEWAVKKGNKYQAIIDAIESVEEAQIRIRMSDAPFSVLGWALIIPFGVDDDETIADCTCNEYMDKILANI